MLPVVTDTAILLIRHSTVWAGTHLPALASVPSLQPIRKNHLDTGVINDISRKQKITNGKKTRTK